MATGFERLVEVMARLRGDDGCPWDRQQTRESLTPFLLEEAHEVLEAIHEGEPEPIRDELGDLLFQVVFHARIAQEAGEFDISEVIEQTVSKMVRRHPHVFRERESEASSATTPTADDVLRQWEELKRQEKGNMSRDSVIDGVPRSLPALLRAHQIQAKAARVGFDWPDVAPVAGKIEEEWRELTAAMAESSRQRQEEELGDLLFAIVNLARFLRINPEEALHRAVRRFTGRFRRMEEMARTEGRPLAPGAPGENDRAAWALEELDQLWEQAKREEQ